jgi:dethiobiotin synthetase
MSPIRWFVTGTDTGVGKTEAACALLSLLADEGLRPAPFKPYESGCRHLSSPSDARALQAAARSDDDLSLICPHRFRAAVAPGVAAMRTGLRPSIRRTMQAFRSFEGRPLIAEGAGGLFVPLDRRRDVIDLIALLGLPVLLVARAGLGTLNHTALSVEALAARNIPIGAILLARSSPRRDASLLDNAALIRARHGVPVLGPVSFLPDRGRRRIAFRRALKPLLQR